MAKAILVMDMPGKCHDCYMCYFSPDEDDLVCADTKFPIETFMGVRPDWCPLLPVPEREDTISTYKLRKFAEEKGMSGAQATAWKQGWNACLDAILGGDDDE
ncbi:MAG: hypothetical protein LUD72_11265 [Bacteroidales bacterium]|nr:hypothetical protein [Bacteroidales bacterium]